MAKTPDIRSYVNPTRLLSKETQATQLSGEVYVETRRGTVIDDLIRSVRRGSIVEVLELGLLAPQSETPGRKRRALADRITRIAAAGGIIREVRTGMESPDDLPAMMVRAHEFIANAGRAASLHRRGNPIELTPEQYHEAEMIWRSREWANDGERLAAIHKAIGRRLGRTWLWQQFGSPSRKPNKT